MFSGNFTLVRYFEEIKNNDHIMGPLVRFKLKNLFLFESLI